MDVLNDSVHWTSSFLLRNRGFLIRHYYCTEVLKSPRPCGLSFESQWFKSSVFVAVLNRCDLFFRIQISWVAAVFSVAWVYSSLSSDLSCSRLYFESQWFTILSGIQNFSVCGSNLNRSDLNAELFWIAVIGIYYYFEPQWFECIVKLKAWIVAGRFSRE